MCGIVGIVTRGEAKPLVERLDRMLHVQSHRGPDGEGQWLGCIDDTQITLGHSRLAIIDLSEAGNQPMFSPSGRQLLIYNGEVYNYRELRVELEACGVKFRTQTDSEVVLQSIITWGEQAMCK